MRFLVAGRHWISRFGSKIMRLLKQWNNQTGSKTRIAVIAGVLVVSGVLVKTAHAVWQGRNAVPDFSQYENVDARKQAFFDYLLPHVRQRNAEILELRQELTTLRNKDGELSGRELRQVTSVVERYDIEEFDAENTTDWDLLLRRVDIVPASLALAQAANESAWGTSRFALQGKNFFGQWCFEPGCGLVPAQRPADASYEVAGFGSVQESVDRYIFNLNHHPAYRKLRSIREQQRENQGTVAGQALANGLESYSSRGEEYVEIIQSMIRFNELGRFDPQV